MSTGYHPHTAEKNMIIALILATFDKHVLDTRFIAESVAIADVNQDHRPDIMAGNVWYEAPTWKPHEIAPVVTLKPETQYSNAFNIWAADLNKDGYPDQILIGAPGEKCIWRQNPAGKPGPWQEHPVWRGAGNESPAYVDLFKNKKKVLVMAYDDRRLAWFEPSKDPYQEWICHDISEDKGAGSHRYSHGLGIGDLNGDGKNEVVVKDGYYVQPKDPKSQTWTFVKADLGPDCAHMLVTDVNGDKRMDVLSTSAHARGVWWHEQLANGSFKRHTIDETISVTHSATLASIDGKLNLVTGKRKWGHPPGVDVGSEEPHWVVHYEPTVTREGVTWTRHLIDQDSGVGTQFVTQDISDDGKPDIISANRNGVFLVVQK